ncbi:inositol 1,4,5-triphosphate receptor associated 2-like [Pithys albifrons albifrons]|uniref:inositol 1,4,5-triphosphate receptor associated 2-like n=1 Tax=Pithys albifrons albifrons TaxID=3385563 RepID=UPI003A5CB53B
MHIVFAISVLEVADLIIHVADLQYNNQRLQEENNKLRLTLEAADETSNKLSADNEHLRQQVKSIQHLVLKAKSLEEELEEARNNLNQSEERREQVLWHNKQLDKENQSLNIKVTSLQEEIIRNSMDTEGLQKKILELSKSAAELEIQVHVYESTVGKQEASLTKKEQDIKELKLTIVECSSIIETLRAEKTQLLENMRHMQQELILNGLCFPLMGKYSSNTPEGMNSLHCELELAQSSEILKTEWTALEQALDREVLLLLQEPEYEGEKFQTIIENLQEEASEVEELVLTSLEWVKNPDEDMQQAWETKLVLLKQELREKRHAWIQKLQLLEKCKETLEKDFVRTAGNLRRTRTEQFHLRKELSARQQEIETVKQLQEEAAGLAEALGLELQEAKKQLEDATRHAEDQVEVFHSAREEAASSRSKLEEAISEQQKLRDGIAALTSTCQLLQGKVEQEKTTANALRWELLQRCLCELLCQCCAELDSEYGLLPTPAEPVKGKQLHYSKRSEGPLEILSWHSSPLLDALNLETSCPKNPPGHSWDQPGRQSSGSCTLARGELGHVADVTSEEHKWKICSAGDSSDSDLPVSITVMDSSLTEPSAALRRVSIATVPRSAGTGVPLAQLHDPDGDERSERFNRRSSSWGKLGAKQNEKRPSLQRFLSTYSWAEHEEEHLAAKNEQAESPTEVQEQPTRKESVSEKGKCSSKSTLESAYNSVSLWTSHFKASFSNTNKTLWVSVSILVLLAALTSFLKGLSLQRPAAAEPVGPGDSWTSLQQLLWPYTRLQHNGLPPI